MGRWEKPIALFFFTRAPIAAGDVLCGDPPRQT
jgi:hypothetical protein